LIWGGAALLLLLHIHQVLLTQPVVSDIGGIGHLRGRLIEEGLLL
jgi:hypothetical protein